jgi:AraC family transcriptional regulator of adaptative response / DNA-3-methyladenine glycosylase II
MMTMPLLTQGTLRGAKSLRGKLAGINPHMSPAADRAEFTLPYRPPYDWDALLNFLRARATPGVEAVTQSHYLRTISFAGSIGCLDVSHDDHRAAIKVAVRFPKSFDLTRIVERVRAMFDATVDPLVVAKQLGADPVLANALAAHPGIRVPGAWDGFELAVRAILGQQVSVAAATTVAGRLAAMFGSPAGPFGSVDRLFPPPSSLADAPIERAGVVSTRAAAIRTLAREVGSGRIRFEPGNQRETTTALLTIHGIGDWTTQYIAMRALRDPDAFPHGDLVLRHMVGARTARELAIRSEIWRPWRSYAVLLLWQHANDLKSTAATSRRSLER